MRKTELRLEGEKDVFGTQDGQAKATSLTKNIKVRRRNENYKVICDK
jgi:hypothetical protein